MQLAGTSFLLCNGGFFCCCSISISMPGNSSPAAWFLWKFDVDLYFAENRANCFFVVAKYAFLIASSGFDTNAK